jgi:hypothetical protein
MLVESSPADRCHPCREAYGGIRLDIVGRIEDMVIGRRISVEELGVQAAGAVKLA